jgi:NitT/TauT family transport system ATP-binding protein
MAQRVSVARAFAYPSDVLLMDEPFKKLDFRTRVNLIESLLKIWALDRRTIIFVTHSIDEAVLIGNKIYVLSSHPVKIKKTFNIDMDQLARSLQDKDIVEIKKEILVDLGTNEQGRTIFAYRSLR